jgi:hypothetical protein
VPIVLFTFPLAELAQPPSVHNAHAFNTKVPEQLKMNSKKKKKIRAALLV